MTPRLKPTFPTLHRRRGLIVFGLILALANRAQADEAVLGTWEGLYVCGQGETALTLILQPGEAAGRVEGLFHFYASPRNPGIPEGCFAMSGTVDRQSHRVDLSAGHWLLQPFGYVSVGLTGRLAPVGDRLSGQVIGPLCRSFDLHRVGAASRAVPPACLGGAAVATVP